MMPLESATGNPHIGPVLPKIIRQNAAWSRLYLLPNVFGLDAALIAVIWQEVLARQWEVRLLWPERWSLFAAVAGIYLLDRWMDGRAIKKQAPENRRAVSWRHQVAAKWGNWLLLPASLFLVTSAWLALTFLPRTVLFTAASLVPVCVIYFFWVHSIGKRQPLPWEKAIVVGIIFSAGVAVAPMALALGLSDDLRLAGVVLILLLVSNCLATSRCESRLTGVSGTLEPLPFLIIALLSAVGGWLLSQPPAMLFWSATLSAAGMLAVRLHQRSWPAETASFGYELALLLPIILVLCF